MRRRLPVAVAVIATASIGFTAALDGLVGRADRSNADAGRLQDRQVRATGARSRSVLSLRLDKLVLTLLGLDVNLDKVVLTISANAHEDALGSLFCQLAHTRVKLSSTAAVARKLTHTMRASGLSTSDKLLGFSVPVSRQLQTTTSGTCPILDLVLGPLHLDPLGLIVDLNQVHLTITADPTRGVLGQLFCSLAGTTVTAPSTT